MANNEIWHSVLRSAGDIAGVFEFNGETGYFYLYRESAPPNHKVVSAIHILSGAPDFEQKDVSIRWTDGENIVGLFIRSVLWAAFDPANGTKYGGNYQKQGQPEIPMEVESRFR
jgi:hypothetical protein